MIAAAALMGGCESYDDTNISQSEKIVSYLEGSHSPTLISESDLSTALDIDPPFYSTFPSYAYRYISTYYDADRNTKTKVSSGSRITITFDIYEFSGSSISSSTLPIYTNDPTYKDAFIEAGLTIVEGVNDQMWSFAPMTFTIGSGDLMGDLETALHGCREGDEVEIYLTYKAAYDNKIIGVVEKESMLRFRCDIEGVEN